MAFPLRFLIDECLSPGLAKVAVEGGYEGAHVGHRGLLQASDLQISRYCLANDLTVVTNNARDFRAIYATYQLHPGVIVLLPATRIAPQKRLFAIVLARLEREPDLINKLVEVDDMGVVTVREWAAPE